MSIPYNEVGILSVTWCSQSSIEWYRTRLVLTIQHRCDLDSQKIFKVSAWCYPDVGSLSIPIILKLKKTTATCFKSSDNCRFRLATLEFDLFYVIIWINNEWNRNRLAIILQYWYDIVSLIKYLKSQVDVTPMLAFHRFPWTSNW